MYINRIRPHDADIKRRQYALNRAHFLDSQRDAFINYCLTTGVPRHEMELNLTYLEEIIATWQDVADQNKID